MNKKYKLLFSLVSTALVLVCFFLSGGHHDALAQMSGEDLTETSDIGAIKYLLVLVWFFANTFIWYKREKVAQYDCITKEEENEKQINQ